MPARGGDVGGKEGGSDAAAAVALQACELAGSTDVRRRNASSAVQRDEIQVCLPAVSIKNIPLKCSRKK